MEQQDIKYEGYDPKYYDLTYGNRFEDIPFYRDLAKEAGGKVLEIACGSGRVYLELLKAGIDISGIDLSERMLAELKTKASGMNLEPKVTLADMRDFNLGETFKLVLIPARSFLHNVTTDDQLRTLQCCRRHLDEGGRLVMNFFYPSRHTMAAKYGKEFDQPLDPAVEGLELAAWSGFVNEPDQVIVTELTWKRDGKAVSHFRVQLAYIYKREFELLLRLAGFSSWEVHGGFEYQPLENINQEMVWVITK